MKVCADVTCNTPIPEGKTRCPKCSKKKFTEAPASATATADKPAEPAAEAKAKEPEPAESKPSDARQAESKPAGAEPPEKALEPVVGIITETAKAEAPKAEAPKAEAPKPEPDDDAHCSRCARLRAALRDARRRIRTLGQENRTLREELLSAGEMIENLAMDLEKAPLDTAD